MVLLCVEHREEKGKETTLVSFIEDQRELEKNMETQRMSIGTLDEVSEILELESPKKKHYK